MSFRLGESYGQRNVNTFCVNIACTNYFPRLLVVCLCQYGGLQARIQEFTLGGAPWIGEGSGDRQRPQLVQGSARWGALNAKPPWKLTRIRNFRR